METGWEGEEVEGEVDCGGDATSRVVCNVDEGRGVGRMISGKDADSILERAAAAHVVTSVQR